MIKKILTAVMALSIAISSEAQLVRPIYFNPEDVSIPTEKIDTNEIISKAIKEGLFLSRQSYQIVNKISGQIYGYSGKKEFGIQYSIGIKVPKGFLLFDKAVRPWIYDKNYVKYEEKFDPLFFEAQYSKIGNVAKYDSLDFSLSEQEELIDTTVYKFSSNTFGGNGFILDKTSGQKDGWIVWISSNKGSDFKDKANLELNIYKKVINISDSSKVYEITKPNLTKDILGGLFMVPVLNGIGIIELHLCGIVLPYGNAWRIVFPFIENNQESIQSDENGTSTIKNDAPQDLTPVNSTADNNKSIKKDKNKRQK